MATGRAGSTELCVSTEQFEAMKRRFQDVGDCLTDQQLLELADCYHEILRWRRDVRLRHAAGSGTVRTRERPAGDDEDAQAAPGAEWHEAVHAILDGAGLRPAGRDA